MASWGHYNILQLHTVTEPGDTQYRTHYCILLICGVMCWECVKINILAGQGWSWQPGCYHEQIKIGAPGHLSTWLTPLALTWYWTWHQRWTLNISKKIGKVGYLSLSPLAFQIKICGYRQTTHPPPLVFVFYAISMISWDYIWLVWWEGAEEVTPLWNFYIYFYWIKGT